jgi:hypothetical protein
LAAGSIDSSSERETEALCVAVSFFFTTEFDKKLVGFDNVRLLSRKSNRSCIHSIDKASPVVAILRNLITVSGSRITPTT